MTEPALPELPEPLRHFLCTKCGHTEQVEPATTGHPPCPKCDYLGFVICDNKFAAVQMFEYGEKCAREAREAEREACAKFVEKQECARVEPNNPEDAEEAELMSALLHWKTYGEVAAVIRAQP